MPTRRRERRTLGWKPIVLAIIAGVPATITSIGALWQATKTHQIVNSRMSEILELAKSSAVNKALLEEKTAERMRQLEVEAAKAKITTPPGK